MKSFPQVYILSAASLDWAFCLGLHASCTFLLAAVLFIYVPLFTSLGSNLRMPTAELSPGLTHPRVASSSMGGGLLYTLGNTGPQNTHTPCTRTLTLSTHAPS